MNIVEVNVRDRLCFFRECSLAVSHTMWQMLKLPCSYLSESRVRWAIRQLSSVLEKWPRGLSTLIIFFRSTMSSNILLFLSTLLLFVAHDPCCWNFQLRFCSILPSANTVSCDLFPNSRSPPFTGRPNCDHSEPSNPQGGLVSNNGHLSRCLLLISLSEFGWL